MRGNHLYFIFLVTLLVALGACRPGASPIPTPAPATTAPGVTSVAQLPALAPEEAAWQKVVDAAKKEGMVNVYGFSFGGDVGLALRKAFRERYGINSEIIAGSGPPLYEKIKVERRSGNMTADVVEISIPIATEMKENGLSLPYGDLPVLKEQGVWLADPRLDEAYILIDLPSIQTNWINTNLVKPENAPKSFKELTDPKWKGKLVTYDPAVIQSLDMWYVVYTKRGILSKDYFQALGKQNIIRTYPANKSAEVLATGGAQVLILGTQNVAAIFAAQGAPIRPLDVEEGAAFTGIGLTLVKDSPHPNAARLFMNWIMSKEGQNTVGQAGRMMTMRTDIPDASPEAARFKPGKLVAYTIEDMRDGAKSFTERQVARLWGIVQ